MSRLAPLDTHQLNYMRVVLGVDSILWPQSVASLEAPFALRWQGGENGGQEINDIRLVALFPLAHGELSTECESLVEKMIRAMRLEPREVRLGFWRSGSERGHEQLVREELDKFSDQPVVVFGAVESSVFGDRPLAVGESIDFGGRRVYVTFSPEELLDSPERKRQAWVHLQTVMKEL